MLGEKEKSRPGQNAGFQGAKTEGKTRRHEATQPGVHQGRGGGGEDSPQTQEGGVKKRGSEATEKNISGVTCREKHV